MAQKRPFDDEEVNEVSSKYQRQDGHGAELILHNDGFSRKADIVKIHDSGETSTRKDEVEYHDEFENVIYPGIRLEGVQETQRDMPQSASLSPCPTSSSSDEEDEPSGEMFHFPYYSECFNFDRPVRPAFDSDDVYHCMLDNPPRKHVLIGPEHQAEIPPWGENTSARNPVDVYPNGMCILSVLETETLVHSDLKAGGGRIDCQCPDQGSIRCVRFHIAESRELSRIIGQDTFMELGFENMGEVVADKWTYEEEQLFHEVVRSNPVSLGRNFWVALSAVFPSRTNMEIVSYYFNVFMLRKRAEQNRCDPMNIDSDDDEWQGNDNDMGQNIGGSDEDDDSGIESPARYDGLTFRQNGLNAHEHEEDDSDVSDDAEETDVTSGQGRISKSEAASSFQLTGKKSDGGENDTQDGSCTSSDSGASVQGAQTENVGCHDWHEYDAKSWDGYLNCPKINVDFLPTCSMIEEIFGGEFDFNDKRW